MRYGLIGETLTHSHSPQLHALLGDAEYRLMPMATEALEAFLTSRNFLGLNVTIPYKQAVLPYCDELSDTARAIGSVNTLVKQADGTLFGDNTDAYGFTKMAERAGIHWHEKKALVLGSGGTSLTACYVIRQSGGEAVVISRGGGDDYDHLERHADADVIVNTTPVGMYPNVAASPVDLTRFPKLTAVLDVIYNPLRTRLLQQAEMLRLPYAGGLTMLVWQGVRARELFDGQPIATDVAEQAEAKLRREMSNLVLVGMPGSGKTAVGTRCAKELGLKLVDTDREIVLRAGKPIPQIFVEDGEIAFRELEAQVMAEVGKQAGLVLATGGGVVLKEENQWNLRMNGVVAWIVRPLENLSTKGRPLSTSLEALKRMEKDRASFYQNCADFTVLNDCAITDCVRKVMEGYDEALRH